VVLCNAAAGLMPSLAGRKNGNSDIFRTCAGQRFIPKEIETVMKTDEKFIFSWLHWPMNSMKI